MSHLSAKDRDIYIKVFLAADVNKDGYLNMEEVNGLFKELGYKLEREQVYALFAKLDTDQNYKITLDEFLAAMEPIERKEREGAHLRRLFHALDANKDGLLSPDELHVLLQSAASECGVEVPKSTAEQIVKELDVSGDGKLNFEEFLVFLAAVAS
ncbi:calmodulin-4-like [Haliotis cracherodii]|uniref:calmodulin-4-like n=1 Tax=Haliotis cracherodii TaxID=6455 RepID=UPI0039ECB1E7